jgi:hypothetical protein
VIVLAHCVADLDTIVIGLFMDAIASISDFVAILEVMSFGL